MPLGHEIQHAKLQKKFQSLEATIAPQHTSLTKNENCDIAQNSNSRTNYQRISSNRSSGSGVEVWDGVFSPEVCRELHELAIDHSERTTGEEDDEDDEFDDENGDEEDDDSLDGSSVFVYRGQNRSPNDQLTPIEQALESFLDAYYDDQESTRDNLEKEIVVEYWCRQEHLNLEAHADVDEVWFERGCNSVVEKIAANHSSLFRYPAFGHVLYLTKPTIGLGPTCVFPPKEAADSFQGSIRDEVQSVVTIPAVPGRILRFPGNALHAVPKPAEIWFSQHDIAEDDDQDESDFHEMEDEEWDDDDDDDERSVILFNTWEMSYADKNDADRNYAGPIGVPLDPMFHVDSDIGIVEMMMSSVDMDGVEINEEFVQGMVAYARQQKNQQLGEWREKYCSPNADRIPSEDGVVESPVVYSKLHCQPRDSWTLAPIETTSIEKSQESIDTKRGNIRVPLMGDKLRRRYPQKTVRWSVPSSFEKGVMDPQRPCEFPLMTKAV